MFGMDYNEIQYEISKIKKEKKRLGIRYHTYNLYMDVYKNKLRKYFDYVIEMSIIGIKSEKFKSFMSGQRFLDEFFDHN